MDIQQWQGLTSNLALIIVATLVWSYVEGLLSQQPVRQALGLSLLAAVTVAVLMALPVTLGPGLVFDLRVAMISFTSAFGGPFPGSVAALVGLALRWFHGGAGLTAGILSVLFAWCVGTIAWLLTRPKGAITFGRLFALAIAASLANLLCLVALPRAIFIDTVRQIGLPGFLETSVAIMCAGALLYAERRRREFARNSQLLHAVVEALPDCLHVKDRNGRFLFANSATAWMMGTRTGGDLLGRREFDLFAPDMSATLKAREESVWSSGKPETYDQTMKFEGSKALVLQTLKAPLLDEFGQMIGLITHNRDISANKKLEDELAETHRRLEMALKSMADGLVQFDPRGNIIFCNDRYGELFPQTAGLRIAGANIADIIRASVDRGEELVADSSELDSIVRENSAFVRKPGSNIIHLDGDRWIETRTTVLDDGGSLSMLTEVTDRMRTLRRLEHANERLAAQAMTDGLTGLSNRRFFDDKLEREFRQAARDGRRLSLVLADVDYFKDFNDAYGHLAGDDCLRLVSRLMTDTFAGCEATLARFGGEEFVMLLGAAHADRAVELAEKFRAALEGSARPHSCSPFGVVTISLGVLSGGRPGTDVKSVEDLVSLADATLYLAKRKGRNGVQVYQDNTLAGRFADMRSGVA